MKTLIHSFVPLIFLICVSFSCTTGKDPGITVKEIPGENRVDITIDGELFTSYTWPETLEKPVLYPLKTASGKIVTRGFPLDPRPGERVDHPHHVGHWFNYGDVNGLDFWNNSYAIAEEKKPHYGTIHHEKILKTTGDKEKGVLEVEASWRNYRDEVLLKENTTFIFRGDSDTRSIERHTILTALEDSVVFRDNKEGMIAIRMDRAFEFPSDKPEAFTDSEGNITEVKVVNNEGRNGRYLSSEGITGEEVWGTRAKWMSLSAEKEGEKISVAIIDHPGNPGYPTYWHARTYGLFSANPLGQAVFSNGEQHMNFTLAPGQSAGFKYMIWIKSGDFASKEELEEVFNRFSH